jgi:hypothetical protein
MATSKIIVPMSGPQEKKRVVRYDSDEGAIGNVYVDKEQLKKLNGGNIPDSITVTITKGE